MAVWAGRSERASEREREREEGKKSISGKFKLDSFFIFFSSSSSNFRRHAGIHLVSLGARNLMIREFSFLSHTHTHIYIYINIF